MISRAAKVLELVAASGVAAAVHVALVRPWTLTWGAGFDEVREPLPGDDVVEDPQFDATRAVTIDAEPSEVWPWLVQMGGYTRGGWYAIDRLDNGGRPSAEEVVLDLQDLHVGDVLATSPDGSGFTVEAIDPQRSLVLTIRNPDATTSAAFVLRETLDHSTRLLMRVRVRNRGTAGGVAYRAVMESGDFVMSRQMLLGIKRRAERLAARPALAS